MLSLFLLLVLMLVVLSMLVIVVFVMLVVVLRVHLYDLSVSVLLFRNEVLRKRKPKRGVYGKSYEEFHCNPVVLMVLVFVGSSRRLVFYFGGYTARDLRGRRRLLASPVSSR